VIAAAASSGGSALWYLARGSGAVTLVLLTVSVALGVVNVRRWQARGWPRFVTDRLHRNVSLLVLVFLGLHILTVVADGFVPISLRDAFVPFGGAYRPLWVGLGAVACDLLLALVVTSVLRSRIGWRGWRAVHWAAYACWPVALIHGLGLGSDTGQPWMMGLTAVCAAAVWLAVWVRVAGRSDPAAQRPEASSSASARLEVGA
jgi:methionine sulfoxide reductase heme-binding subunit